MPFNKLCYLILSTSLSLLGIIYTNAAAVEEYQLKAVFLYNLTKGFITWPKTLFADSKLPFYICILGLDPFGEVIEDTIKGQTTLENRSLNIERITQNLTNLPDCHILFISKSEQTRLPKIFNLTSPYPILTVSDIENFAQRGGMVEFFTFQNKVRLVINSCALEKVGLKANANLLRLAKLIRTCQE